MSIFFTGGLGAISILMALAATFERRQEGESQQDSDQSPRVREQGVPVVHLVLLPGGLKGPRSNVETSGE